MKAIRNLATLAALALMIAACGTSQANAQSLLRGTFRLPFPAQWGSTTLPAGNYAVRVDDGAGWPYSVIVTVWTRSTGTNSPVTLAGNSQNRFSRKTVEAVLIVSPIEANSQTQSNMLECVSQGSICIVHEMQLGPLGETLYFPVSKSMRIKAAKRGGSSHALQARGHTPELVRRVPITIS